MIFIPPLVYLFQYPYLLLVSMPDTVCLEHLIVVVGRTMFTSINISHVLLFVLFHDPQIS